MGFVLRSICDIKVGDFITCWGDQEVPADVVLIYCSGDSAFVDTTNLDGEMVIKEKIPVLDGYGHNKLMGHIGLLKCTQPNPILGNWSGSIVFHNINYKQKISLETKNFLLRGSCLKSTDYIVGLVTYVGADTKIQMHGRSAKVKWSWLL